MTVNATPVLNDPDNPLVAVLIYNYRKEYLKQSLDSIFHQNILTNIEIILIDDATNDGSWEIALEYAAKYPNIITVSRNRRSFGPRYNHNQCMRMAKAEYCAPMTGEQEFLPEYIDNWLHTLKNDPYAQSDLVLRKSMKDIAPPSVNHGPLVSILCYNYNYGRYLRQCLESAFAQTYENIELCFSDNASSDESWNIALEFANKYPGKMRLTRNRMNFGPDYNFANCYAMMSGKYFINYCSDDMLAPDYVERCVQVFEANQNVGMIIVNRAIIDEHDNPTPEAPFYNCSCIIPGEEQAAVYMMAGINPSVSQVMYRSDIADGVRAAPMVLGARYYGTRILDFNISLDFDIAFLQEPLLLHRIHSSSDTSQADTNLMPVIGLYVLNHQFADIASTRNQTKVISRLPQSINKLGILSVRYCVRFLLSGNEQVARKYFNLATAIHPEAADDATWQKLQKYWQANAKEREAILEDLAGSSNLATRTISYDPPSGSRRLLAGGKVASS